MFRILIAAAALAAAAVVYTQPDTREKLLGIGVDIRASTPEELAAFHRAELAKWAKIVKDSGAKLD